MNIQPIEIEVIVEIPVGSKLKYEIKDGEVWVDRVISIPYPFNYGYIPNTLWDDGDALDVCILGADPIHPKSHCTVEILGVIEIEDNGVSDSKVIGVLKGTSVSNLNALVKESIEFFTKYKSGVKVKGFISDIQGIHTTLFRGRTLSFLKWD